MVLEYEFGIRKAMKSAWMCWPTTIKPDRLLKDPIQPLSIGLGARPRPQQLATLNGIASA